MAQVLTPEAYQAYVRRNERWNLAVNMLDMTFFYLSTSFIFGATVMSLYVSRLTSSALLIGLIPAVQGVGFYIPQLFLAHVAERLPRKKPLVQKISVFERLPYLVIGLSLFFWPDAPWWLAYTILMLNLATATAAGGLAAPAWKAMLAKVIPANRRGLLFGGSQAIGGLLGLGGAALAAHILATQPYPRSYAICFLLSFAFHVASYTCIAFNREPPLPTSKEAISLRQYLRCLPDVLRHHRNFRRYLVGRTLIILGTMGVSFYVVYARRSFGVTDAFAAQLTMAALLSATIATPLLGVLADRLGHKWLTELCTLIAAAAVLVALVAPRAEWFFGVFMLMNAATAGMSVAGLSLTMEFSTPEDLPTFTALADTLLAAPVLVAPLLGGWLVDLLGFKPMFGLALTLLLVGWGAMRWTVREPRTEHAASIVPQA